MLAMSVEIAPGVAAVDGDVAGDAEGGDEKDFGPLR
jgi:hypothetical protein